MRFRRFRRSRGPREPLIWHRKSFVGSPWQTPVDGINASLVDLFDPATQAGAQNDQEFTIRRLILNMPPLLTSSATLTAVSDPWVANLKWFLYIDTTGNPTIPTTSAQLFSLGTDIIAGGAVQAQIFGSGQNATSPPWFFATSPNFIDVKVNRRISSGDFLGIWSAAYFAPMCDGGTPIVPGEDDPTACWIWTPDVSVLFQRSMRRR